MNATAAIRPSALARSSERASSCEFKVGSYRAHWSPLPLSGYNSQRKLHAVALHGMVESPAIWRDVLEQVAFEFCGGYELSMPWHCDEGHLWGLEARPDEWLQPMLAGLPSGRKVVFAHSFGACALLSLLQRRQYDDIHAVILLSPYYKPTFEEFTWDLFRRCVGEFEAFVADSIRIRTSAARISAASLALLVDKVKDKYGSYSWVEFYSLYARMPALNLAMLEMPVLILCGDRDLSIIPHDLKALADRLPNARLELLAQCGHFGMVEQPDAMAAKICSFLADIEE
jgi:pimeloyl-ACP methyl ester carboxylesterase